MKLIKENILLVSKFPEFETSLIENKQIKEGKLFWSKF